LIERAYGIAIEVLKLYFGVVIYPMKKVCMFQNNRFIKKRHTIFEEERNMRLFRRKSRAVKKWRSRAWSIDPKKTKLTIIKAEALNLENPEFADLNLTDQVSILSLPIDESSQLLEFCTEGINALTDMEQII
jgi:hypothetical protein